jgi:hypothetical protein
MSSWNTKKGELSKLMGTSTRTKRKKDPNAPKKWKTSYISFCDDQRDKVKKANPEMSATEITTKLGALWKALSEKDKKKYEESSKKDRARYEKEMESYTPPEDESDEPVKRGRGAKKERTGPKRPLTAYMYFCQDKRQEVKEANPDMNGTAVTAELGSRWKDLSDEDKAPYEAKQAADKARYENEKASGSTADSTKPAKEPAKRGKKDAKEEAPKEPAKRGKKEVKEDAPKEPAKRGKKEAAKEEPTPAKQTKDKPVKESKETKETAKELAKGRGKKEEAAAVPAKGKKTDEVKKTPGYEYFLKDCTEELESENPDWGSRKVQAEVNKRWKELSDDDREAYEMEAAAVAEEGDGSEVELEDD